MLFSQQELAALMSGRFECVWEELRPAPHVRIDFKNGYVLERTLNGNVATLFCTPEGLVYDVLPGIMDAASYSAAIEESSKRFYDLPEGAGLALAIETSSRERATRLSVALDTPLTDATVFGGKGFVEAPVKKAIGATVVPLDAPSANRMEGIPRAAQDRASLEEDTRIARTLLLPQALELLANHPLCTPEDLAIPLFRDVLHVDLLDPYLGLAPDAIGGDLGRYGPASPDDT